MMSFLPKSAIPKFTTYKQASIFLLTALEKEMLDFREEVAGTTIIQGLLH